MKEIPLSGRKGAGLVALVDDEDYPLLSRWSWSLWRKGYAQASVHGRCGTKMHWMVMGPAPAPELEIDHKNRNGLDNRRSNLRWVTHQQNTWNATRKPGTSGYLGVSRERRCTHRPWKAQIRRDGTVRILGYFASAVEAAIVYDAEAVRLRGDFANVNFPENLESYLTMAIQCSILTA